MSSKLACLLVWAIAAASAAPPPGIVSAAGAFKINGRAVPAAGAASVPVTLGDEIASTAVPVVIRFDEYQAVITVDPQSVVQSGELDGVPFVRLVSGSLQYNITPGSKLVIFKAQKAVKTGVRGAVSIAGHGRTVAIAGVGGGAAAGVTTVALVKRSKTCPDGTPKDHDCGKSGK